MPIYVYEAINAKGSKLIREATAPTEDELRLQLEGQGLLVKSVRQKRVNWSSLGGQKVKPMEFLQCNQEFITLLKAGLNIPEALDLISDRPDSLVLTSVIKQVLEDIKTGSTFSDACAKYPKVFDGLYISSLKTGERAGNLAKPLARYQDYLRQKSVLQGKVSQAMVYPIFLLGVLVLVLGLLFTFVMPRFAALYTDFGAKMPLPTVILMSLVKHLALVMAVVIGGGLLLWGLFKRWSSTPSGRLWLDGAVQRIPVVNQFMVPFMVAQMARTLATLLSGGTPLTTALKVARDSMTNRSFQVKFDKVIYQVSEGKPLSKALRSEGLMPRSAVKLIEVGEASGQLEQMFQEVANSYEMVLENRIQRLMALIEPIFILLTGLLIGTVIVVMYLPIIHLSDIVK